MKLKNITKERWKSCRTINCGENEEIWKDIKGYNGKYQISNLGRVKSFVKGNEAILKPKKHNEGYLLITLCKNAIHKQILIHRLVAEAFLPNPNDCPCVNHKNEDKSDNRENNLEWCSYKYNSNYGTCKMRMSLKISKPVLQYTKDGEFIKEWRSIKEAEEFIGIRGGIKQCLIGRNKTAGGFVWKRKE